MSKLEAVVRTASPDRITITRAGTLTAIVWLNPGDTVKAVVFQTSTVSLDISANDEQTSLSVAWIGP